MTLDRFLCLVVPLLLTACISEEGHRDTSAVAMANWILRAPVIVIAVLVGWWLFSKISRAASQAKIDAQRRREQEAVNKAERANNAARARQIEEMKASLPKTPPQRMRATIRIHEMNWFTLLPSDDYKRELVKTEVPRWAVDLILEISEQDRELIKNERLYDVVIEKSPKYSTDQLLNIFGERDRMSADLLNRGSFNADVARETMRLTEPSFEALKKETTEIKLSSYLQVPYTRTFDTKPEANDYSDELRDKILPRIRKILDTNATRETSGTIEF